MATIRASIDMHDIGDRVDSAVSMVKDVIRKEAEERIDCWLRDVFVPETRRKILEAASTIGMVVQRMPGKFGGTDINICVVLPGDDNKKAEVG